jgi:hypothetical protein
MLAARGSWRARVGSSRMVGPGRCHNGRRAIAKLRRTIRAANLNAHAVTRPDARLARTGYAARWCRRCRGGNRLVRCDRSVRSPRPHHSREPCRALPPAPDIEPACAGRPRGSCRRADASVLPVECQRYGNDAPSRRTKSLREQFLSSGCFSEIKIRPCHQVPLSEFRDGHQALVQNHKCNPKCPNGRVPLKKISVYWRRYRLILASVNELKI